MINFRRHFLCLLASACLLPTAYSGDLFVKNHFYSQPRPIEFEPFQKFSHLDTIGGYPIIPLGNDLSLANLKISTSTLGTPLGHAYFFDIRDNKFFASMDIEANLQSGKGGDWIDEPCKRNNYLWKRSTGGKFTNINCASINHLTRFWENPSGDFQQLLVAVRQKKLEIPPTVVQIVFTTYSSQSRRVVYKINLNPEFFGFERDPERLWGSNSWYKDYSRKDQNKSAFIAKIAEWATIVQDQMTSALEQDANAFHDIPSMESFIAPPSAITAPR